MSTARKNIAIVILGVFAFPIIFQSIHRVLHHRHTEFECPHIHHKDDLMHIGDNKLFADDEKNTYCAICEYHFTNVKFIKPLQFQYSVFFTINTYLSVLNSSSLLSVVQEKSARAPPVV